jgi:hypothetical protein
MGPHRSKLDVVSRVTFHLFAAEVAIAAILAWFIGEFHSTFSLILFAFAVLQALAAAASHSPPPRGLNEWDGAVWLVATSMAVQMI